MQIWRDVDLFDQLTSTYRVRIHATGWINATVVNAWRLFCKIYRNDIPLLKPLRKLVLETLGKYGREQPLQFFNTSRIGVTSIKLDILNLGVVKNKLKHFRCQQCGRRTNFNCEKCNVSLEPK